jgi:hypothetical protein
MEFPPDSVHLPFKENVTEFIKGDLSCVKLARACPLGIVGELVTRSMKATRATSPPALQDIVISVDPMACMFIVSRVPLMETVALFVSLLAAE